MIFKNRFLFPVVSLTMLTILPAHSSSQPTSGFGPAAGGPGPSQIENRRHHTSTAGPGKGGDAPKAAPPCTPPPAGMVAWYAGDGNANDIEGGNDASISGDVSFTAGEVDQAFTFGAEGGEVMIPHTSALDFGSTDSFTVDAWLKPDPSVLGTQRAAVSLTYVCSPESILLLLLADGRIDFSLRDSNGTALDAISPASILDGQWHQVTGVRDVGAATVKLYLDGVVVASLADTTTGTFTRPDAQDRIGSIAVACPIKLFWLGQIDEVEVFRRALSQTEVQAIVNAGAAGKCKSAACSIICPANIIMPTDPNQCGAV